MTIEKLSEMSEGIWKQIDFPAPVGRTAIIFLPEIMDVIISSCPGRKDLNPKYFSKASYVVILKKIHVLLKDMNKSGKVLLASPYVIFIVTHSRLK